MKKEISPVDLSDKDLLALARQYGGSAKDWLKQFAGLLPEIFNRRLYKSEGFASIHHYAKIVAGMNEATVDRILNLRRKLEGKPLLLGLFESGKQGWTKLEKVVPIATPENDEELAEVVKGSSSATLNGYVKGKRVPIFAGEELKNNEVVRQVFSNYRFRLSIDVMRKLRRIKQKLENHRKEALSWNEAFEIWDEGVAEKIILSVCVDCATRKGHNAKTRSIPRDVQRLIRGRYGDICPISNCENPWTHFHHKKRYAIFKSHDPDFIVPLCQAHHDAVHDGLIANEPDPPWKWYFRDRPKSSRIDEKVKRFKK